VIAGGVGSYTGAYAFALTIGFLQALTSYVLPGAWTTVGVYGAILLLILLRPSGLGRGWKTAGA
jgi:branched-subunit amino acid ABC-type transport system permease component